MVLVVQITTVHNVESSIIKTTRVYSDRHRACFPTFGVVRQ